MLIQLYRPAENRGIGPEMRFPRGVTQYRYAVPAGLRFTLIEHAAHESVCPQNAEKGRRGKLRVHMGRIACSGQTHVGVGAHGQLFKCTALALPVLEVCQGSLLGAAM